jgi:hypothetical protein
MLDFRDVAPVRSCTKTYVRYKSYKKYLVVDFKQNCGYCNSHHSWHGGIRSYHIDHFAPKDQFETLATTYSNLVYACSLCNTAKSNKWPSDDSFINIVGNEGFYDPCNTNYNDFFYRDNEGFIFGKDEVSKYMVKTLNLNLEIHAIIWNLSRLERVVSAYKKVVESGRLSKENLEKAKDVHYYLLQIFFDYVMRLKTVQ